MNVNVKDKWLECVTFAKLNATDGLLKDIALIITFVLHCHYFKCQQTFQRYSINLLTVCSFYLLLPPPSIELTVKKLVEHLVKIQLHLVSESLNTQIICSINDTCSRQFLSLLSNSQNEQLLQKELWQTHVSTDGILD